MEVSVETKQGCLGVQCPELLAFGSFGPFRVREIYRELQLSERGKDAVGTLSADPRVQSLVDNFVVNGQLYEPFDFERLVEWYLWRINNAGEEEARRNIESYLNESHVEIVVAIWITGLNVDKIIPLFDGFEISPQYDMPEAFSKYSSIAPRTGFWLGRSVTQAAIRKTILVPKVGHPDNSFAVLEAAFSVFKEMQKIIDLLCLFDGCRAVAESRSVYCPDRMPFGIWSEGSSSIEQNYCCQCQDWEPGDNFQWYLLEDLYRGLCSKSENFQEHLRIILRRIAQAKNRPNVEDRILDLVIALEMLLLNCNADDCKKSRLANRGSCFLADRGFDRESTHSSLIKLYELRCDVVHDGFIVKSDEPNLDEQMAIYEAFVEDICSKIVENGWPDDWTTVTEGVV